MVSTKYQCIINVLVNVICVHYAEVCRRDYRAWYGLGQAYEILKMPMFSLYYYKIAQHLRPYDSRMLVALGETYEKLDKHANALKCFQKASNVGDIEGIALLRLADLFKKLGDIESAVPAYLSFCSDERAAVDKASLCRALVTLGNYYESIGHFDRASHFAYRCLEYDDVSDVLIFVLLSISRFICVYFFVSSDQNGSAIAAQVDREQSRPGTACRQRVVRFVILDDADDTVDAVYGRSSGSRFVVGDGRHH